MSFIKYPQTVKKPLHQILSWNSTSPRISSIIKENTNASSIQNAKDSSSKCLKQSCATGNEAPQSHSLYHEGDKENYLPSNDLPGADKSEKEDSTAAATATATAKGTATATSKVIKPENEDNTDCKSYFEPNIKSKKLAEQIESFQKGECNIKDVGKNIRFTTYEDYEELIRFQEAHLPVPEERKNDEPFKIRKMRDMKRLSTSLNKSVKKYQECRADYEKNFKNDIDYSALKRRKVSYSTKKDYSTSFKWYDQWNREEAFPLYQDTNIGIYAYWQDKLIQAEADDDVLSDDEQIKYATYVSIGEFRDSFREISEMGKGAFINFNRFEFLKEG